MTNDEIVKRVKHQLMAFYALSMILGMLSSPGKAASEKEKEKEDQGRQHVKDVEDQAHELATRIVKEVLESRMH